MSNIEDDIKIVERYLENSSYKESDSDFFKNGGWEMVDLEIPKAMANILSEREQDKARIKELELQNKQLEYYIEELKKYNKTVSDRIIEYKKNSIPKQKVKEILDKAEAMDYYTLPDVINDLQELLEEGE